MKTIPIWIVLAGLLSVVSVQAEELSSKSTTVLELGPVRVGEMFPTFGAYTLTNQYLSLTSLMENEKTIVVSYFATWCGPCRVALPKIEQFVTNNDNVEAVYIALGEKSSAPVKKMADELNLNSPIVIDKFESIGIRHGVVVEGKETTLPRTFILKPDGTVQTIVTVEGSDFVEFLTKQIQ